MTITPQLFKAAMGQLASGVSIITMHAEGEDHGFTASSITSVSLEPMLVLVCVVKTQRSHVLIEQTRHFAVNILSAAQVELGARFASSQARDRFGGLTVSRAVTGAPILAGSLAWVDCRLHDTLPGGDHSIFLGEVLSGAAPGGGDPLVYCNRQWGSFRN